VAIHSGRRVPLFHGGCPALAPPLGVTVQQETAEAGSQALDRATGACAGAVVTRWARELRQGNGGVLLELQHRFARNQDVSFIQYQAREFTGPDLPLDGVNAAALPFGNFDCGQVLALLIVRWRF
jgi:hypothetical protein